MALNIKNNKKTVKAAVTITASLLIIASLCLVTLEKLHITNFISTPQPKTSTIQPIIDNSPPTTEQKTAGELQKKATSDTPPNNDLGISITSINTSNDPISIKSVISGAISNSGTCTLTLAKGNVTVTKQAGTYALPNSSTCKGFDINKSELSAGEWRLQLSVNVDTKTSSINDNFSLE